MQEYETIWNNPSIKYGLTGGLITILILVIYYMMGIEAFTNTQYSLAMFGLLLIVNLGLGIWAGLEEKQNNNGYLPFKDAVIRILITFVIVVVFYHAFYYLLFNFIDPSLQEASKQQMVEQVKERMANNEEVSKEDMQEQIKAIKESSFTLGQAFFLTFIFSMLSFAVALVLAAFIRNDPESEG